jgi:hypothetical protein
MKGTIRKGGENNLGLFTFHSGGRCQLCRLQAAFFPLETEGILQKMSMVIATRDFASSLATVALLPGKWLRTTADYFADVLVQIRCLKTLQSVPVWNRAAHHRMELLQQAGIAERLPEWWKIAEAAQMNQGQLVG